MSPEFPPVVDREKPLVWVDEQRLREVSLVVLEAYQQKRDLFDPKVWGKEIKPPEEAFMQMAKVYAAEIGDDRYPLHAAFFMTMIMFADNSINLLNRLAKPSNFRQHAWLFQPEVVTKHQNEEVMAAAQDYSRASYNGEAIPAWQHNAQVIIDRYDGDLRNFFAEYDFNAPQLLKALNNPKNKIDGIKRFGPKLAALHLLWVHEYDLVPLNDIDKIGIPVDFQVVRLAVQTGALRMPDYPVRKDHITDKLIPAYVKLAHEINLEKGVSSQDLSVAQWFVGHHCCNNYEHGRCPLKEMCSKMIARKPIDRDGTIDPTDIGRNLSRNDLAAKRDRKRQIEAGQQQLFK